MGAGQEYFNPTPVQKSNSYPCKIATSASNIAVKKLPFVNGSREYDDIPPSVFHCWSDATYLEKHASLTSFGSLHCLGMQRTTLT